MRTLTKTLAKGTIGTVAAGAMALISASPAMARDRHRDHDGIDAGDVIAGALIIGGIAAIASASSNNRDRGYRYDDYRYRDGDRYDGRYGNRYDYDRRDNPRRAVEMCVRAAEGNASRYSYGRAKVTDIRAIDRKRDGYKIKGRIAVNTRSHDWRRGWDNDYRGYDRRYSGYDSGRFTCQVRHGRVVDIDYHGIRGL
jgi:hypothetical protein